MSLAMQGTWTVSVKSKSAAAAQRFTIAGAASGNGTYVGAVATPPVVVTGPHWTITVEAQDGTLWKPSEMRFKNPVLSSSLVKVDLESNDFGPDKDFNDLILTCSMPSASSEFVIYGHATAYSGLCLYNPCFLRYLVIDSYAQLVEAVKNPIVRTAVEKLYPEFLLPGPKNPPDPAPLRTFTPLVLPTPRSPGLPPKTFQVTQTRDGASTRQLVFGKNASVALLDSELTKNLGVLQDGFQKQLLLCTTTTLGNYGLRFQEYDRTASELGGGPYTGTGNRENLGVTATDPFGNYVFRFSRSPADIVDETLHDVAVGEDATVQALPDLIAQVLGAGQIPAAETGCYFNVTNLYHLDICVPATGIVLPSSCVDNKTLTFIGKISMTSAQNTLDGTGRITAHSTAGNAPQIDCGVWWGNLDLWGCLPPEVICYTVRWRPLGAGAGAWQFHGNLETREVGGGLSKKIGPFSDLALGAPPNPDIHPPPASPVTTPIPDPGLPKVNEPRYLNAQNDPTIVQPGAFLKATLGSSAFPTGSYEVSIDGYDGSGLCLKSESHILFIDNETPYVAISNIWLAGAAVNISGVGCTLQTLTPAELSANLDVRYKVDHSQGGILNYALAVVRCNESSIFPTTYVSGGQPSFTWVHGAGDCETPPNFRRGTLEDPAHDGTGFVTTTLSPNSPWLGATENFTILRVSVGYNWRATNGYSNASGWTYGPLVWGIQK